MPRLDSPRYTILFAAAVSVVCAALVSVAAVSLRDRQEANAQAYRQKNVLLAAGLAKPEESLSAAEVQRRVEENIVVRALDLSTGQLVPEDRFDIATYDPRKARNDPKLSRAAPPNDARVARLSNYQLVYLVKQKPGSDPGPTPVFGQVVLPIEGMGMWGMISGFLAIDRDGVTVRGITFYEQKETPGLGGEIANPRWQALWQGRKAYDPAGEPQLTVIKGRAGPPEQSPGKVDGLSGATITSNSISHIVRFWLSRAAYGPFLARLREGKPA